MYESNFFVVVMAWAWLPQIHEIAQNLIRRILRTEDVAEALSSLWYHDYGH